MFFILYSLWFNPKSALEGLKVRHNSAYGNAIREMPRLYLRPERATENKLPFQGANGDVRSLHRALPCAELCCAFGAPSLSLQIAAVPKRSEMRFLF